jgi:hypothetical protein
MPLIGKIMGGLEFNNHFIALSGQTATTFVEARKGDAHAPLSRTLTMSRA